MRAPSYVARFARRKITVDGAEVEVFIMGEGAALPIGADISEDMDRVSAQMAYWGSVLADAKKEAVMVDAFYRAFRANCEKAVLKKDPKIAAWKVKGEIDGNEGFLQHKNAISIATRNVELCANMFASFEKKANQLQSIGKKQLSEMGAQGMTTKKPRKERGWNLSGDERDDDEVEKPVDGTGDGDGVQSAREKRMADINAKRGGKKTKKTKKRKD